MIRNVNRPGKFGFLWRVSCVNVLNPVKFGLGLISISLDKFIYGAYLLSNKWGLTSKTKELQGIGNKTPRRYYTSQNSQIRIGLKNIWAKL